MAGDARDFYAAIPVFDDFAEAVKPANYRAAARRLGRRIFRCRRLDQGGRRRPLQGGQHGRRRRHRGGRPMRSDAARFRSCSAATGRASRSERADARGGDAGARRRWRPIRARNSRFDLARRHGSGRRHPRRRARRAGGALRRLAHCAYAMFSGGGLSWFEAQAKRGAFALDAGAAGRAARSFRSVLPLGRLAGPARRHPVADRRAARRRSALRALLEDIVRDVAGGRGRRPAGDARDAAAGQGGRGDRAGSRRTARVGPGARSGARPAPSCIIALGYVFNRFKLKAADFDMRKSIQGDLAANADFRKFDDGLRMTLDCSPEFADALETRLAAAGEYAEYGTFRQEQRDDHLLRRPLSPDAATCISSTARAGATRWRPRR